MPRQNPARSRFEVNRGEIRAKVMVDMPKSQPELQVVARAPFRVYYEGPALSLSAANKVGPFDILPGHADFFSMLVAGDVTISTQDSDISFPIYSGMITVRSDQVMLFVNM